MPRLMIWVSLLVISSGTVSVAQDNNTERYLEVRGISELDMKPLGKATAHLYDGTKDVQTLQTGSDGSFSFRLEINKQYTIEVEKDGLVAKRISFNTTMPDEEKGTWMNEFSIGLVKYCDGVDYAVLKEPVDIVKFDPKGRQYVSDKEYVNRMRPRLENILVKYDKCMMDKYEAAIKKADQAFMQNNTNDAIAGYQEALLIYPRETYPAKQINEINKKLGKEQKSSEEAEKKEWQNKEESYNLALAKASVAYTRKDYATARQYYQEALAVKPEESLPKGRLEEIAAILNKRAAETAKAKEIDNNYKLNVLKADSLLKLKDYQSAREQYARASAIKPGEGYPKAKSQEIDKIEEANARAEANARKQAAEKEYQDLITQADNQFKAKSYDEARAGYAKALTMRPADPYTSQRIKLVENSMVAEKQLAREEQITKQYKDIIATADQFLQDKEPVRAREAFSGALALKPDDEYAQSKISTIDNMMAAEQAEKIKAADEGYKSAIGAANTAITQKSFVQAREFLQKALSIKPGDPYATNRMTGINKMEEDQRKSLAQEESKKKQYNESLSAADKLFLSGDLSSARSAYAALLLTKPGDSYCNQKITAIDNLMAAKTASKIRETDSIFSHIMSDGSELMVRREYEKARESFHKALAMKPSDPSATDKLRNAELMIQQEKEKIDHEQVTRKNYSDVLSKADREMDQKQYTEARQDYEEALEIMPGEVYPRQKLVEISTLVNEQEKLLAAKQAADKAYILAISNGEKYFSAKDYYKAKDEYTRALSLKPAEELPKTRIAEIADMIEKQQKELAEAKTRADDYASAINSGNMLFASKNYATARNSYAEALKIIPGDKLAKEQIARIDKIVLSASRFTNATSSSGTPKTQTVTPVVSISELIFKTESERQRYQDELKKKYPAGITLEKYREQYKEILRYIIIRDNQAMDYRQIRFLTYNGFQYSVNGTSITQLYFLSQVKTRQGESFQEIEMQ